MNAIEDLTPIESDRMEVHEFTMGRFLFSRLFRLIRVTYVQHQIGKTGTG
jgi:hypothetical protein